MHAFSDDKNPMNSGLVFNPSNSGQGEDGILYSHEIYTMDFQAELAILSACNTGAGALSEGEGVMSLARAFAYAGVPSTSMSLWRANDETIAQIMQSFHMYLNEGMEKSAAMQKAKLDFLESSDRTHPYFWAAFLTIGDDSPIDGTNFPVWAYFLIGILLLLGLYIILRRNK
ncbi:MAG: CHAT domain-containing protein, partial [Bacteroidota bacterium]